MIVERHLKGIKPLSVNHIWLQHGKFRFRTAEYNQFKKDCHLLIGKKEYIPGLVEVEVKFFLIKRSFAITDTDNLFKALIDVIAENGIIDNDNKIIKISGEKILADDYGINFIVRSI